ncbi:MAG: beta-phosphoglucomutase, partial [Treponema sp.]|nr:beta-phosphoglucomutase [Treponema sp.]
MKNTGSLVFTTDEYGQKNVGRNETLFTTANGYLGLRGDYEEKDGCAHKGTYINGIYDTEPVTYGENAYGYAENHETILNLPDPKHIELTVNGKPFTTLRDMKSFRMSLDFRTGIMTRTVRSVYTDGISFTVCAERLVSFTHKTCAAVRYTVTSDVSAGSEISVRILSGIDTTASNISAEEDPRVGAKFSSRPLIIKSYSADSGTLSFSARTRNSGISLYGTVIQSVSVNSGKKLSPEKIKTGEGPYEEYQFALEPSESAVLTKFISYDTTTAEESCTNAAAFARAGFDQAEKEQREYLSCFWETACMHIDGSAEDEKAVNFNTFHLLQSAGKDGRSSIAAKGLTAEGYEGHYFWDSEAYVCPVFTYIQPDIARALLAYRVHILPYAEERASEMSLKGALFPWRTISGHETSAYYPAGTAQYHIDADIMFALSKYLTAAGYPEKNTKQLTEKDICTMAVETARMWMSLGCFVPEKSGKFCINEVTGPDEYTACVDNNTYTNLMARENLRISMKIAEKYHAASDAEIMQWKEAADNMYIPFDTSAGIYPQDDSFMAKADWDFKNTPAGNYPLLLHYHPLVIYRHRVLKQPDLVLAQFLLSGLFSRAEKIRNFLFYEKYTTGDSSLSHCIQCIAACEASDIPKAESYFAKTVRMDIEDINGNTADGIHTACMAGSWMAVVYGFGGFRDYSGMWSFNPQLPGTWKNLSFSLRINGMKLELCFTKEHASYTLRAENSSLKELTLTHRNIRFTLHDNETKEFDLRPAVKAVLFDLDGVITDTAELHFLAWKVLAGKYGLTFDRRISSLMNGRSRMDSLELLLSENKTSWPAGRKLKAADEKNKLYVNSLSTLTPENILPGITEFIDELKNNGIKCILASASRNAPQVLEKLGLTTYFDAVVDPSQLQKGKPEPDIYIKAAELSGEWYTDCIGIEDAQSGIDAIKKAGIRAVG